MGRHRGVIEYEPLDLGNGQWRFDYEGYRELTKKMQWGSSDLDAANLTAITRRRSMVINGWEDGFGRWAVFPAPPSRAWQFWNKLPWSNNKTLCGNPKLPPPRVNACAAWGMRACGYRWISDGRWDGGKHARGLTYTCKWELTIRSWAIDGADRGRVIWERQAIWLGYKVAAV